MAGMLYWQAAATHKLLNIKRCPPWKKNRPKEKHPLKKKEKKASLNHRRRHLHPKNPGKKFF